MNPDTDPVRSLIESIAAELERPREVSNQVTKHLDGAHGIDRDSIGPFLENRLPQLEDYEHDLILSPLFTPKLADQAVFAQLLGSNSMPRKEWPALIQELATRSTNADLITSDKHTHLVTLREVSIERFVHRLRLDGTISKPLLKLIEQTPAADHPMLMTVARRAIWENGERHEILLRMLSTSIAGGTYSLADAVDLLKLVEDYLPADYAALLARIPRWHKLLEEEINAAYSPKPFFSTTVQQMHGGNDQRSVDAARLQAKQNELAFLDRLLKVFAVAS